MYLASERKEYILKLLAERGAVRTIVLSKEMDVTDETVRNDLILLEKNGLLKRVHGGAISLKKKALNDSLITNVSLDVNIAKATSRLVEAGKTIFIDGGVLGNMTAAHLPSLPMAIVTNSPTIIGRLEGHIQIEVYCTGGLLDRKTGLLIGHEAAQSVANLNLDTVILTPDSYDPVRGAGYSSLARAEFCHEIIKYAKKVIIIVTKYGIEASATYFPVPPDKVDVVVTNENVPEEVIEAIEETNVSVLKA